MNRSSLYLIAACLMATPAFCSAFHLSIGFYDGATGTVTDLSSACENVFGFMPTNVLPVNYSGGSQIEGLVGFDENSLQMSFFDLISGQVIPVESFISDVLGFEPLRLSVVHGSGQFDELLGWDFDRIVLWDLDNFELRDVTAEFSGAVSVSGLCLDALSNVDQSTVVYDGEDWYLNFDYVTDVVNGLLGTQVVRLTPFDLTGGPADDAILFTFRVDNYSPVAEFSITPEAGDTSTTFRFDASDSSDNEDELAALRARWDFDSDGLYDTELSTEKVAYHSYSTPGEKSVTLLIIDSEGATGTQTHALQVGNVTPTAEFSVEPESGTVGTVFIFDASASYDYEDATEELQVRWDFNSDGAFETDFTTQKTAINQYTRPMLYTVTLQVRDSQMGIGEKQTSVLVENIAPIACFTVTPTSGTVVSEFEFDASCSFDIEDALSLLRFRWDWQNDGEFDTEYSYEPRTSLSFWDVGTHIVKLEVIDTGGATRVAYGQIVVQNTPPHAAFLVQPQEGTVRTAFTFNASLSYDLEDEASKLLVRWDFNSDGTFDTVFTAQKNASKSFSSPGPKTITLEVADSSDMRSTTSRTVTVTNTGPTACFTFTPSQGDTNTEFLLDASCTSDWESSLGTLEFRWDFEDDGGFDTEFSSAYQVHHRYSEPGTKTVALEARDEQGLTEKVKHSFEVQQGNIAPVACFTITPPSGTTETAFELNANCSSDPDCSDPSQLQVRWDFDGNGTFDTGFSQVRIQYHTYSTQGYKTCTLEVKDANGGTDTTEQRILVEDANTPPVACFTISPDSGDTSTVFSFDASCSTDPDGTESTLQYRWDFDNDGTFDTSYVSSPDITHQFHTPGTKTVVLEVMDEPGDTDTTSRQVTVESENEAPHACFSVNPLVGDTATDFHFDASCSTDPDGTDATLQVRWDWENNGSFDTSFTTDKAATHRYTTAGTKTVRLQVRDVEGATDQTTWTIEVNEGNVPPTACFTATPQTGTTETDFHFDASCSTDPDGTDATLKVRWDWNNDGSYDTSYTTTKTITHRFDEPGHPTIVLQVMDGGGATGQYAKQITVDSSGNNPPVAYFTVEPDTGTVGTVFFFDASGSFDEDEATPGTLEVQWDFNGDGAYDTSYTTQKTVTHSFDEAGAFDAVLRVRDPEGAIDTYTRRIYVY